MSGFLDIHSHVLPGIDDGPKDPDGSVEMLRRAAESGTSTIVATPHLRSDFPDVHVREIAERCATLNSLAQSAGIDIRLLAGAEVSLVWALDAGEEELRLASYGQRGTDLLIETPLSSTTGLGAGLYEIYRRGYRITLAHPERSRNFQEEPSAVSRLIDQGMVIQVNADSLLEDARKSRVGRLGRWLCTEGLAHVLASDGHRAESWRPVTSLALGVQAAGALVGPERAQWMARDAPAAVLEGRPLAPAPPVIAKSRSRLLRRR
jgi:protein-tyrosine phosphatase